MTANNKPSCVVLLIQKEVAERVVASAGDMSILAISAQIYAEASLGPLVPAEYFTPPPKVDSQVVILKTRKTPLISAEDEKTFFRIVKAGFGAKRKKLRSSISGNLGISKERAEKLLLDAGVSPDDRAEDLTIESWRRLAKVADTKS